MGGFLLAEKERCAMYRSPSIAHRNAMLAPPKHSRLAPSREILLVLSLAFARLFCHRQRSQRSLSREFESFSAIKKHRKSGAFLLAEKERLRLSKATPALPSFVCCANEREVLSVLPCTHKTKKHPDGMLFCLAEKERFELSNRVTGYAISSRAPSTN